jgi:hypothetical protein
MLFAKDGHALYALPTAVFKRLTTNKIMYYRMIQYGDDKRTKPVASVSDADWKKTPSVAIGSLPVTPPRSPAAAFTGSGPLADPDFAKKSATLAKKAGMVTGRDQDFRYVILDAAQYRMTAIECHEWGLTDTISSMPQKPDALINAQFISSITGVGTEGQVIRDNMLINSDSQPKRYFIAQLSTTPGIHSYTIGTGNPNTPAGHNRRTAFGGLGPLVIAKKAITPSTAWEKSIFAFPAKKGKGAIALHKSLGIILLIVQEDSLILPSNAITMNQLQLWLVGQGFDDAVFNDGSDSESLFAAGSWLLTPGYAKNEAMDFAFGFVKSSVTKQFSVLAIDGTKTKDAETFVKGIERPLLCNHRPRNCAVDLKNQGTFSGIAPTFKNDIIEAWRATTVAEANIIGSIIQQAGAGGSYADIMYISSHAWRQGELWFHPNDSGGSTLTLAHPWRSSFKPSWNKTPRWLILAGCGVLGLRYSRGIELTASERSHLIAWHQDTNGPSATVPGLSSKTKVVFETFHPGVGWFRRIFKACPSLRGVLGYWFRSPSDGVDVDIMSRFSEQLRNGSSFLSAWSDANNRSWYQASAPWAAMVRTGAESDMLATLENTALSSLNTEFMYYDTFTSGLSIKKAYDNANKITETISVGGITLPINSNYDQYGVKDLEAMSSPPALATFLQYNDGIGL